MKRFSACFLCLTAASVSFAQQAVVRAPALAIIPAFGAAPSAMLSGLAPLAPPAAIAAALPLSAAVPVPAALPAGARPAASAAVPAAAAPQAERAAASATGTPAPSSPDVAPESAREDAARAFEGQAEIPAADSVAALAGPTPDSAKTVPERARLFRTSGKIPEEGKSAFIENFVDDSELESAGLVFHKSPVEMQELKHDPDSLFQLVSKGTDKTVATAWVFSWFPFENLRMEAFKRSIETFGLDIKRGKRILSTASLPLTSVEIKDIDRMLSWSSLPPVKGQQVGEVSQMNSKISRILVMAPLALFHLNAAQAALERARNIMSPNAMGDSLPEVKRTVLTDPRYQEGIRKAALKIIKKVEDGLAPQGDLFGDVLGSFLESGIAHENAVEFTWNIMGVLATHGPNLGRFLESYRDHSTNRAPSLATKVGLAMIAGALPILNFRSRESGRPYSYPNNVKTHADNGKSYYFWMSAYLAHRIARESGNPYLAGAAAFTLSKGYSFISRTFGRSPERTLEVDSFDGANNVIRADLTYAAAGARYGTLAATEDPEPLDIDEGLHVAFVKAAGSTALTPKAAASAYRNKIWAYLRWNRRFAPDAIFRFFNR
jgi:hypothetical protein